MKLLDALVFVLLLLMLSCKTPTQAPPPVTPPPGPPVTQTWTNALRLPDGGVTPGIAIYLPQPASAELADKLGAAGAVKRSATT